MAVPARGYVRGSLLSLLLPALGWVETHMTGGSWHHHTGTWWGRAKARLVEVAGRKEAPGKNSGSVPVALNAPTRLAPTPLLSTNGTLTPCQAPFAMLYI